MATRSAPCLLCAWRAAIAALLNRQKPIAVVFSAWWPGGRDGDEDIVGSAGKDIVHGGVRSADRGQRRLPALRADGGVAVDALAGRISGMAARTFETKLSGWA